MVRLLKPTGARSIPACAGEPMIGEVMEALGTVYPRVCGGTDALEGNRGQTGGLSPRVRGNPPSLSPG